MGNSFTPFRGGVGCLSRVFIDDIVFNEGGGGGSGGGTGGHNSSPLIAGGPSTTLEGGAGFVSGDAEDAAECRMAKFFPLGSFLSSEANDDDEKLRSVGDND